MPRKAPIRIGTSGWSYDHWVGPFYPEGLPSEARLAYYAKRFDSAEINHSFYRLPSERTLRHWRDTVPPGFLFTAKASRYITHMKKLKDPASVLGTFLDRIAVLDERLGPILFQLPPRWGFDAARFKAFLEALPGDFRYAFEMREHSWLNHEAYDLLEAHGAALCIYDLAGFRSPKQITADFVYVRLHGPDGAYRGSYDTAALSGWARAFSTWTRQGIAVYCYFDNDDRGYAAANAARLAAMLT